MGAQRFLVLLALCVSSAAVLTELLQSGRQSATASACSVLTNLILAMLRKQPRYRQTQAGRELHMTPM